MNSIKRKSFNANVDLIHGPIFKSLIIFALPLFISNIFQQLYNTVDTMIVGNFLGDASLAAIGSCTSIYDLLVGFALGIGNGLAIVTARSFGSKDEKLLKKSVASHWYCCFNWTNTYWFNFLTTTSSFIKYACKHYR